MTNRKNEYQVENLVYNIAWLRKHHGISKKKMGEILHVGIESINQVEKGILPRKLTVDSLFSLWEYFGIFPTELMNQKFGE